MSSITGELKLYLVLPIGSEDRASVLVARSEAEAVHKGLHHPNILDAVKQGCQLVAKDLTSHFNSIGYTITVSEKGMFH